MRVIAIEEHFATPMLLKNRPGGPRRQASIEDGFARSGNDTEAELLDLVGSRLRAMDANGVDMQVLSLNSPGAEGFPPDLALAIARDANDCAHEAVKAHPTRFAAFAAVPSVDPPAAVKELERAVTKLGCKGVLINGRNVDGYLDDRKYWPIFEAAESLGVAVYLHPWLPHPDVMKTYFNGNEDIAAAAWGFGIETGSHFMKLMMAGLFDQLPKLKFILGHLGEGILFWLPRMDVHAQGGARRKGLKKTPKEYITEHLLVTTSGHFSNPAFRCAADTIGIDRILFAIDWPMESNKKGMDFLRQLPYSPDDLHKLAHGNAERLLGL